MNIWNRVAASDKLLNLLVIYYTLVSLHLHVNVITVMQYTCSSSSHFFSIFARGSSPFSYILVYILFLFFSLLSD